MSLKDSVEESVGWARRRLDKIRLRYMDAIHEAERQGGSRLEEIKRQVEQLGPGLRHLVDEQFEALQHKLDEINQRLAEEAVPEERKSRVGRLELERKAASAARMASSMVRSRTRSKAAEKPPSRSPSSATSGSSKSTGKRNSTSKPKSTGKQVDGKAPAARGAPRSRGGATSGRSTQKKPRKSS